MQFKVGDIVEIVTEFYDVNYKYFKVKQIKKKHRFIQDHEDLVWLPEELKLVEVPDNKLSRIFYPTWVSKNGYLYPKEVIDL